MLRDISHRHWRAKYCPSHGREGNANPMIRNRLLRVVSRGRNRTYNIVIKSHLLRQIERSDHRMQTGTAARKSLSSHANFTIEPLDQKRARDIALCRSTGPRKRPRDGDTAATTNHSDESYRDCLQQPCCWLCSLSIRSCPIDLRRRRRVVLKRSRV